MSKLSMATGVAVVMERYLYGYIQNSRFGTISVPNLQQMTVALYSSWLGIEVKCGKKNQAENQGNTSL